MNKQRLIELADALENLEPDIHFDMDRWLIKTVCGTTCCIAGLASMMWAHDRCSAEYTVGLHATRLLGLTHDEATELFMAYGWPEDAGDITPTQAAHCIRNLVETGIWNWRRGFGS